MTLCEQCTYGRDGRDDGTFWCVLLKKRVNREECMDEVDNTEEIIEIDIPSGVKEDA